MPSYFKVTSLCICVFAGSPAFANPDVTPQTQSESIPETTASEVVATDEAPQDVEASIEPSDLALKLVENEVAAGQAGLSSEKAKANRALTLQVAVYSLELQNVPTGIGQVVSDALLAEVRKIEGISAIGMDEITQMVSMEAQKQMMGCEASESCLAQIAGALGVDELITGTLTELADGRVLMIRRIDQRQAKVIEAVQERLKIGSGEEFLLAIGPSVEKLYGDRTYRPGTTPGVPDELVLRLNPPPVPSWLTESIGWAGAGMVAAAGLSYGITYLYHDNRNTGLQGPDNGPQAGSDAARSAATGQALQTASLSMLVTGLILNTAFGALYALTDWENSSEDP
jgi:hypothetical protein